MMPKIQASHTGSYLLVVIALLGAFVCNLSYAQVNPFGLEGEIELWTEEEIPVIEILRLRDFRATPTLATDGPADVDVPLVSLTWTNPPEELVELETAGQSLYQLTL
ncbi:MAG: hypothetical protein KAH38_12495, partial [Candidatus Hydrogenedentes bacterium]|nr:hypothetical protein [Candidatus Hydrogenedentota bacterium]